MEQVEEYLNGIDFKKFSETRLLQDGVVRQLEIIGEATKNISSNVRNQATEVPWKDMAGMRDKLIHQYFGVDLQAVWATAQQDLPQVKIIIEKLLT